MLQLIGLIVTIITSSQLGSPVPVVDVIVGVSGGGPVGRPHPYPHATPTPAPIVTQAISIVQR